ncbi:hypothetical protein TcCL_ESM03444 [Trypanosoma cruzi]|nr:hypothetical protein TcCL_ESM03444 [Trypanosoma cruzi]
MYCVLRSIQLNTLLKRSHYVGMHIRPFMRHETCRLAKLFFNCVYKCVKKSPSPPALFLTTVYRELNNYLGARLLQGGDRVVSLSSDQIGVEQSTGKGSVPE